MGRTIRGGVVGAGAGLAVGVLGELAVLVVRWQLPTDVVILGFVLYWAVPLGFVVGAILGWRGWLTESPYRLAAVAAVPGLLVGALVALLQWSAQ